jgi:glycosyltransferase involved in cell wall biosynthesis
MRLGIQARELSGDGGTNIYVKNLLAEIEKLDIHEFDTIFVFHNSSTEICSDNKKIEYVRYSTKNPVISDHIILPHLLSKYNIDVKFFPKDLLPIKSQGTGVVTVHDMGYLKEEKYRPFINRTYSGPMQRVSCNKAAKVIAISENTKKDILKHTNIETESVEVIHHGVSDMFLKRDYDLLNFRNKYNLPIEDKIIYGSHISMRKNWQRLISSFKRCRKGDERLVFTGLISEDKKEKIDKIERVQHIGRIDRAEMPKMYQTSTVLVYASLFEGFGLPIIEAMASSTPVITSEISPMKEVGGNACIAVDPYSTREIENAIRSIMDNHEKRSEMIRMGENRSKGFTWEKTAKKTLKTIRQAYNE